MDRDTFLTRDSWHGSYYELAMEFWPQGNDQRILQALTTLWSSPWFVGPWTEREHYRGPAMPIQSLEPTGSNSLYGVLQLTPEQALGCRTLTVREENGADWLDLCIPTGMLGHVFPLHYPLYSQPNAWMVEVDRVLLAIAETVYARTPFDLAIIGEEVSGFVSAQSLTTKDLSISNLLLPASLVQQLGGGGAGIPRASGLHWFPRQDKGQGPPPKV